MFRGWYFAAILAYAASVCSYAAYAQSPEGEREPAHGPAAPSPTALPPATSPAGTAAIPAVPVGVTSETPWFQRFLLPVPEATQPVDDWLTCNGPGVMGQVDYLFWSARRSGLDFAALESVTNPDVPPVATFSLNFDRSNGVRGGLGYRFESGWNVLWTYTYFRVANQETVTSDLAADPRLIATQSYLDTGLLAKTPMTSITADGAVRLNIHDVQAEWSSCLNDTVGFKAFGGFRYAQIDQTFNIAYAYAAGNGNIALPNLMDAEGVRLGAEFQWRTPAGLRVFARGAQSVLVGDFRTRYQEVAPASNLNIDVPGHTATVVPVVEAAAGLAYARGPWEFRGGYEMSDWFNLVQVNRPPQSLLLDGFFLSLSFSR